YLGLAKIAKKEYHPLDRRHWQDIQRDDGAVQLPHRRACRRQPAAQVLTPGTRSRPQIDDQMPGLDQIQRLVYFLELVGRARTVALMVGQLDVGVVHMVVQPRPVDFPAFRFHFHTASIIRAWPKFNSPPPSARRIAPTPITWTRSSWLARAA